MTEPPHPKAEKKFSSSSTSTSTSFNKTTTMTTTSTSTADYCEAFDSAKVEAQLAESRLRRLNSRTWGQTTLEAGQSIAEAAEAAVAEARMRRKESR
jgi:hypothetical protein